MNTKLLHMAVAAGLVGYGGCAGGGGGGGGPTGPEDLVDDLEDGDDAIAETNGRLGGWYTFHDDTMGGTQMPPDTEFTPTAGGAGGSAFAAGTTGSGFADWGAGLGFDLNNPEAVGETGPRGVYDLGAYKGIAFKARGTVAVRLALATSAVTPTDSGGSCTPSTTEGQECEDLHGTKVNLTPEWQDYQIELSQLRQEGWGKAQPFDPAQVMSVLWSVDKDLSFDVAIDDVRFYE